MRKLKNWTITSKAVKHGQQGLLNYNNYLEDIKRHKGQKLTRISPQNDLKYMLQSHNDFIVQNQLETKRHKGGRPANVGWSSQLSYPFDISEEDFRKLRMRITSDFYNYVNITEKLNMTEEDILELIDSTISVIHSGETVNNHIHMIFNKVMKKRTNNKIFKDTMKLVSIDLTKKKYLYNLKIINDKAVEDILKINKADYTIKTTERPQKKRKTRIQIKMEKLDKKEAELYEKADILAEREQQLDKAKKITIEQYKKVKNLKQQYEKNLKAFGEMAEKYKIDIKKQREYMEKHFEEDLKRHTKYMSEGKTIKADKLADKIETKLKKTTNTINKLPKM